MLTSSTKSNSDEKRANMEGPHTSHKPAPKIYKRVFKKVNLPQLITMLDRNNFSDRTAR